MRLAGLLAEILISHTFVCYFRETTITKRDCLVKYVV